ncbi:hypothetical protein EYF80_010289 [Liparis tanakae]|uniref:Uncharacterized protein n=1 Tax=Liparis tanakae TaxID=230148 RepID=A0A4Z2INL6_9TELE|nr:hypothetical protein EYF80_010289 [Liparis tanakae]
MLAAEALFPRHTELVARQVKPHLWVSRHYEATATVLMRVSVGVRRGSPRRSPSSYLFSDERPGPERTDSVGVPGAERFFRYGIKSPTSSRACGYWPR